MGHQSLTGLLAAGGVLVLEVLRISVLGRDAAGFNSQTGIFRKRGQGGVWLLFCFILTQAQLGKASAFRTPNSISLCKMFFCKIDYFLRLRESQRNFTVELLKSTTISLLCPKSSSRFPF